MFTHWARLCEHVKHGGCGLAALFLSLDLESLLFVLGRLLNIILLVEDHIQCCSAIPCVDGVGGQWALGLQFTQHKVQNLAFANVISK